MRNLTWRQIAVILGCVLAFATLVVGVYGLVRGPEATEPTPAPRPSGEVGAIPEAATPVVTLEDRALPHTTDPIAYARAVATSLFDWDTSLGFLPTDYTAAVLADADPSGEETPGLIADVATYLPTVDQWLDLGAMEVRQTIEIDDAYVPESWTAAVAASPRPSPTGHDGRDRHRHAAPERRVERRERRVVAPGRVHRLRRLRAVVRPLPRPATLAARQPTQVTRPWASRCSPSALRPPYSSHPAQPSSASRP